MKITIDTNTDSREDIKKAIRLLLAVVGEGIGSSESSSRNIFDSSSPSVEPGAGQQGNIFGSLFDGEKKEESKSEEIPELEPY